jgi:two-component system, response regulator
MSEGTILLVEDNEDDELLTLRAFKGAGIGNEVVVVRDGVQALEYLFATGAYAGRNKTVLPRVVLLDLNLPKIGGLEVLKRLREDECTKLLSIVILTSSKEEEDIVRSYELGANSYVRKPVDFAEFARAVKTLGLYWLLLNQPPPAST